MTKPIYVDIHIHTSDNPDSLNESYDVDTLISKIKEKSNDSDFLISLTDHNVINKKAYLELKDKTNNVLLGVELHIRNQEDKPPYHCHIIFNLEITSDNIDALNVLLDGLYPVKVVNNDDTSIPNIQKVINTFENFDFLLLPHGGQSHSAFNTSVSRERRFDNIIERNIYYNHFDGFTARSSSGLERTKDYFNKLGIGEFINLVTCTDNYSPNAYPSAKSADAEEFVPTWMLAEPTFDGFRISLSESSRLIYSQDKPDCWTEHIQRIILKNELVDIDVSLTPGLNVVIGESSSGKTLLVDSLYKYLNNSIDGSVYSDFDVSDIEVINPAGTIPHYIHQNYIIEMIAGSNKKEGIEEIDIVERLFPPDKDLDAEVTDGLNKFKKDLKKLFSSVENIEKEKENIQKIPIFSRLILKNDKKINIAKKLFPSDEVIGNITYSDRNYKKNKTQIEKIQNFITSNPFSDDVQNSFKNSNEALDLVRVFDSPHTSIIISGETVSNSAVLREGTDLGFGYKHIFDYVRPASQKTRSQEIIEAFPDSFSTDEEVLEGIILTLKEGYESSNNIIRKSFPSKLGNARILEVRINSEGSIGTIIPN